ncbi:MAG TPA: SPFH domain-containing protein [Roseiflexaceae bacterium]|nr:SPFH domain-containing protein [Roseiflexaceae bacterium]
MKIGARPIFSIIGVLIVIALASSTFKYRQIDEGQRGVIITQGAVEDIQEPGIFFRVFAPFTRIETVNVRRQTRQVSQNVASSDKQLYDIDIQIDYSRKTDKESLKQMYGRIGISDEQLTTLLDGFINDALKSASTQFTLDQALSDRGGFSQRIRQFLTSSTGAGQPAPVDQLYINLEAVKVLDIKVGEQYARLLSEKANLEVQIETEEKRRQQIEAQQANNLFQAEQEAKVSLTQEKGRTAAALEAASREAQVRNIQGKYWRDNPELLELRRRELVVEMMKNGNMWFIDPSTNLTLLLNNMATGENSPVAVPVPSTPSTPAIPSPSTPETPETPVEPEQPVPTTTTP